MLSGLETIQASINLQRYEAMQFQRIHDLVFFPKYSQ